MVAHPRHSLRIPLLTTVASVHRCPASTGRWRPAPAVCAEYALKSAEPYRRQVYAARRSPVVVVTSTAPIVLNGHDAYPVRC